MPKHSRVHTVVHKIKTLGSRGEQYKENPQADKPEELQANSPEEPLVDVPEHMPEESEKDEECPDEMSVDSDEKVVDVLPKKKCHALHEHSI